MPFRWLNVFVPPLFFTPDTLPPLTVGRSRYGVLGHPVAHSLSPDLHQAGFQSIGLKAEYLRVEIPAEKLTASIPRLLAGGFQGWNCTLPHKHSMFFLVDQLDASATEAQSVNTVRVENGRLHGFSTDAAGWRAAILEQWNIDLQKSRILILGCGGVGQTLARSLARTGCRHLTLVNRDPAKARKLLQELETTASGRIPLRQVAWQEPDLGQALRETDLLIHGTSLGLHAHDPLPFDPAQLPPETKIYDTVYHPNFTPLVRAARKLGRPAEDGLGMLLHQGALSFTLWTGRPAPLENMRHALWMAAGRKP